VSRYPNLLSPLQIGPTTVRNRIMQTAHVKLFTLDGVDSARNVAYQVERRLGDLGGAVAEHERARAEMLVAEARQAVKEEAPIDRLRSLTGELQQIYHALGAASPGGAGGPSGGGQGPGNGPGPGSGQGGGDDVIDAEFTTG